MSGPQTAEWTRKRRVLAWLNLGLQAALLLALLVVVNLIARRSPQRIDLTSRKSFRLTNETEDVLKNLSYDVKIWINPMEYDASGNKSLSVAIYRTKDLLEEFARRTRRLGFKILDPQDLNEIQYLQSLWPAIAPATIYIQTTLGTGRTNKKAIEIQQLFDGDPVTGEVRAYRGEGILLGAIRELGGTVQHIVYESDGHQELVTDNKSQMYFLQQFLTLNEGIKFKRITLNEFKSVPNECELLMIMAPSAKFEPSELDVLRDYLERGGNLLVAVKPKVTTGLEKFLEDYGVRIGNNIVMDPQQYTIPRMSNLKIKDFNVHEVNRSMVNLQFVMPDTCTVDPIAKDPYKWKITPLAMAGPGSWAYTGDLPAINPVPSKDDPIGNMKVMVAVEKTPSHPLDPRHSKTKIDVWGSYLPFTNGIIRDSLQHQYVINHFRWLLDKGLMEINAENISVKPLELEESQLSQLFWISVVGFPAFGLALGILAWVVRRK